MEGLITLYEFKHDLNNYLSDLEVSPVRTLKEVIAFNLKHKDTELKYFGQELLLKAQDTTNLEDPKYLSALEENHKLSREKGIDSVMKMFKLDALVMPTTSPSWMIDPIDGNHSLGGSSQPGALAGYPAITVPAGFVFGLPVGITFIGRAYDEPVLIKLAYAFEQLSKTRTPPEYLRTAIT